MIIIKLLAEITLHCFPSILVFGITSTSSVNDVEVTISSEEQPISCDTRGK